MVTSFDNSSDPPNEWHLFNYLASFPQDDEPFDYGYFFKTLVLMMKIE